MKPFGISLDTEKPAVGDPLFAAEEVLRDERPIGPGQHVRVHRVDLAELRAHLAGLQQQAGRQRRERDVAFLHLQPLRARRQKEIGARVRIDDRLKRRLDLGERQRRLIARSGSRPATPTKLPITDMSGLNTFELPAAATAAPARAELVASWRQGAPRAPTAGRCIAGAATRSRP